MFDFSFACTFACIHWTSRRLESLDFTPWLSNRCFHFLQKQESLLFSLSFVLSIPPSAADLFSQASPYTFWPAPFGISRPRSHKEEGSGRSATAPDSLWPACRCQARGRTGTLRPRHPVPGGCRRAGSSCTVPSRWKTLTPRKLWGGETCAFGVVWQCREIWRCICSSKAWWPRVIQNPEPHWSFAMLSASEWCF